MAPAAFGPAPNWTSSVHHHMSVMQRRVATTSQHLSAPGLGCRGDVLIFLYRSFLAGVTVLQLACASQPYICGYVLAANLFSVLVDLLSPLLPQPSQDSKELCSALLSLLASVTSTVSLSPPPPSLLPELMDCVRCCVMWLCQLFFWQPS